MEVRNKMEWLQNAFGKIFGWAHNLKNKIGANFDRWW